MLRQDWTLDVDPLTPLGQDFLGLLEAAGFLLSQDTLRLRFWQEVRVTIVVVQVIIVDIRAHIMATAIKNSQLKNPIHSNIK